MSSLTQRRKSGEPGSGCLAIFFLLFAIVGGALLWFLLIRPMLKVNAARSWEAVPCTVVESRVDESSGDDGSTYKALVNASYRYGGAEHQAPYDFSGKTYSSGYDGKAEIVARYPVGSRITCYVNPEDPSESVISREMSGAYLFGLLGLFFMLPGIIGLFWMMRGGATRSRVVAVKPDPSAPFGLTNPQGDVSGPVELKPKATPLGQLGAAILGTLFWNGLTWTIIYFALIREPDRHWFPAIILSLFALIGLVFVYAAIRQFLMLFNPRPRLTLSPSSLRRGEVAYLQWRLTGATGGARRLLVTLEGKEEVRYRRGTDTLSESKAFAAIPLVDTADSYQMLSGSTSFAVPSDTLPSFASQNNKVTWSIKARLEIAHWPDSEEEFEILVRP